MAPCRVSILTLTLLMLAGDVKGAEKVKVDAAVNLGGPFVLLMAGDSMLTLRGGNQFGDAEPRSRRGLPDNFHLTAASNVLGEPNFFYYGPDYYYESVLGRELVRLSYTEDELKFFRNRGPDAAAWRDGKYFFFRGCKYARPGKFDERTSARNRGLPCKPDAAWSTADDKQIILLKGDEIWVWDGANRVEGPVTFSSVYNVTSWELIPSWP